MTAPADAGRRKVCFALPSLAGGGAERAAVQVLNALDGDRWQRWMYLFAREGPYLADVSTAVQIESPSASSGNDRMHRLHAFRRFIQLVRPDVVVAFLSYFSILAATRLARTGTRVIFNQQTPVSAFLGDADYAWSRRWRRRIFTAAARAGFSAADLIVATSRGVADDLVASFGVRPDRVRTVPNPVDLDMIEAAAREPIDPELMRQWIRPAIVAAGRLAEAKNYPLLIEAFAIIRGRMPASLFILGAGEREAALRALIASRGLDNDVHLCGFQPNPWKFIAQADVFALTSRYEGFGNVLVEAMACGVPVVATASPGPREIVRAGVDGLVVEHHEPAAVAAALDEVLGDAERRYRMSLAGREHAARYRPMIVARDYDRVLTEAVA